LPELLEASAEEGGTMNQRWTLGRDSYRKPSEPIRTAEYEVAEIQGDALAKAFIQLHHYSRSYPAARVRVGLYRHGALEGVAVFSHPCRDTVLTGVFGGAATDHVELGRFVLLDAVPGNGETWFLARAFDLLRRRGLQGVISFSDPLERTSSQGLIVKPGHVGTIYQALNGRYLGRATPRTLKILPDGTVLSDRAIQKIRAAESGWTAAAKTIVRFGADEPWEDRRAWLSNWLGRLTRPLRHRGNHKYAWGLDRRTREALPSSKPFPKEIDRC
jgi:hypothetical protein